MKEWLIKLIMRPKAEGGSTQSSWCCDLVFHRTALDGAEEPLDLSALYSKSLVLNPHIFNKVAPRVTAALRLAHSMGYS